MYARLNHVISVPMMITGYATMSPVDDSPKSAAKVSSHVAALVIMNQFAVNIMALRVIPATAT
jgi:hypothetical protein